MKVFLAISLLIVSCVRADTTEAYSPTFGMELRESGGTTEAYSQSFATDTRYLGNVASEGAAVFVLNTLGSAPVALEITGAASVAAGGQSDYRVYWHAGNSVLDVTENALEAFRECARRHWHGRQHAARGRDHKHIDAHSRGIVSRADGREPGIRAGFCHGGASAGRRAIGHAGTAWDGFNLSPIVNATTRVPHGSGMAMQSMSSLGFTATNAETLAGAAATLPDLVPSGWQAFGSATEASGTWTFTEQADAGIWTDLAVPVAAMKQAGGFRLWWPGVAGKTYRVLRSKEIGTGNYTVLARSIGSRWSEIPAAGAATSPGATGGTQSYDRASGRSGGEQPCPPATGGTHVVRPRLRPVGWGAAMPSGDRRDAQYC